MATWAIRLDFGAALVDDEARCRRVAELLTRPCFRELGRISARRPRDRWLRHGAPSVEGIVAILRDRENRSLYLDTPRRRALVASGDVMNGIWEWNRGAVRFSAYLVVPLVAADVDTTVASVCELADALDAGAGFIAVEPDFHSAQRTALGGSLPAPRIGLSDRRRIERRGRHWHQWQLHDELAGIEWGTFLGAEHLARLDLDAVRASGAFVRVVRVTPRLAFLQVTDDPTDDLRDSGLEPRLAPGREVLAPILMDLADVNLLE